MFYASMYDKIKSGRRVKPLMLGMTIGYCGSLLVNKKNASKFCSFALSLILLKSSCVGSEL